MRKVAKRIQAQNEAVTSVLQLLCLKKARLELSENGLKEFCFNGIRYVIPDNPEPVDWEQRGATRSGRVHHKARCGRRI